jgi:probable HAF family extracellular repeat protein
MSRTFHFYKINVPNDADATLSRLGDNGTVQGTYSLGGRRGGQFFSDFRGTITPLSGTLPQQSDSTTGTILQRNTTGEITGVYFDINGTGLFYGTDGNLTKIPDPSPATSRLFPSAISDSGFIVTNGTAEDVISPNGDITPVTAPEGITSFGLSGISDKGEVVGNYRDSGDINHPFYERLGGSAKPFDVPITPDPNASGFLPLQAFAEAVNAAGAIVGEFTDGVHEHGFLYSPKTGEIDQIDVPNAADTFLKAINNRGEIGGWYDEFDNGTVRTHAFVADTRHIPGINSLGTALGDNMITVLVAPHSHGEVRDSERIFAAGHD